MTTATLNQTATVRDLIFAEVRTEPVDALAKSMREQHALEASVSGFASLTAPIRKAVEHEVATVVSDLLSMDLFRLAAAGWRRHDALTKAARRTRDTPAAKELVALVTHQIKSSHRPNIELLIGGKSVATIEVKLDVVFDMAGLVAVVQQARLTRIDSGNCTVTATLAIAGKDVAKRRRQFDLPGAVNLNHGIELLPADHRKPGGPGTGPTAGAANRGW